MLLNLPQEIISYILVRLPAKFLIQMNSICRVFSSIISDRYFARSHLNYHQEHSDKQLIVIEIFSLPPGFHDYWCINFQEFKHMEKKEFKIYQQLQEQMNQGIMLRASCDGLLLLESKCNCKQLYVSNPVIGHCCKLPLLQVSFDVWKWALVLDGSVNSGYMVFGISVDSCKCCVFKPGLLQWEELDTPYKDPHFLSTQSLALVNNELRWLVIRCQANEQEEPYIYSVKATTEGLRFRETKVSEEITCSLDHNSILEVKGLLGLTDEISCRNQLDIWTLNEGDKMTCRWIKNYTINLDSRINNPTHVYSLTGGCYSCRSLILIQYKNQLIFYDLDKKNSEMIDIQNKDGLMARYRLDRLIARYRFAHIDSLVKWE